MKIDIPKNLWISSAEVGTLHGGVFNGAYGMTLTFSGAPIGDMESMSEILEPLLKVSLPKRKIVRIQGQFPADNSITLLIRAFQSWGFLVHGLIRPAQAAAYWIPLLDWTILQISKLWVPTVSNELWYNPALAEDATEIPEPKVPNPERTVLFLEKGHSAALTTKFILGAKFNWNLL